jgi:FkbM family methyltransferase
MLKYLKNTYMAKRIINSRLVNLVMQSMGDWRYPFMLVSWWLSSILVPRRRILIDDLSFTLSCTNWITHYRWYLFKTKEPEVRFYIDEYVKDSDIYFDIGTNVGVFSIYAAKRHPGISVYCFEPEYSNLNTLKENIIQNNLMYRTKIYSVAVTNFIGLGMIHLQDVSEGAACHTVSKQLINMTDEGYPVVWSEGVFQVTLDYLCEQLGIVPNSMKIDTDGSEDKILEGAVRTLSNNSLKSLVIEIPHEDKRKSYYCYKLLESAGLSLSWSDKKKTRNEIWIRRI